MTVEVLEGSKGRETTGRFGVPAKRVASYAIVIAVSLVVGWYAHARLTAAPGPVALLDIAQNALVLTPSGDPEVQMTVANFGDLPYRLSKVEIGKHLKSSPNLIVAAGSAETFTAPIDCASLEGHKSTPQVSVEFVSSEGDVAQFGYLPPMSLLKVCASRR